MAQGAHGVDFGGPLCGQEAGEQSNDANQQKRAAESDWIEWFYVKEKALQPASGAQGKRQPETEADEQTSVRSRSTSEIT